MEEREQFHNEGEWDPVSEYIPHCVVVVHVGCSDQLNTTGMNAYSLLVGELGSWKLWLRAKEVCRYSGGKRV